MALLFGPLTPHVHVDPRPYAAWMSEPAKDTRETFEAQARYVREALARGTPTDTSMRRADAPELQPFTPYVAPKEQA